MSTLEARIAEVLAAHKAVGLRGMGLRGPDVTADCKCGVEVPGGPEGMRAHQAAALAPVIREREAEAWDACVHAADKQWTIGHTSAQLLRNTNPYRADKLDTL